jgi:hypothetical protein
MFKKKLQAKLLNADARKIPIKSQFESHQVLNIEGHATLHPSQKRLYNFIHIDLNKGLE